MIKKKCSGFQIKNQMGIIEEDRVLFAQNEPQRSINVIKQVKAAQESKIINGQAGTNEEVELEHEEEVEVPLTPPF